MHSVIKLPQLCQPDRIIKSDLNIGVCGKSAEQITFFKLQPCIDAIHHQPDAHAPIRSLQHGSHQILTAFSVTHIKCGHDKFPLRTFDQSQSVNKCLRIVIQTAYRCAPVYSLFCSLFRILFLLF